MGAAGQRAGGRRLSRGNGRQRARWGCLAGLSLALAAGVVWLVWQALPEAVDPTWQRVVESGVLPVCTDPSWPPFESVQEGTGEIQGLDVDLARLLAARLAPGVQARIVTVGFDGLYDALLAGRCDAVLSALPYEPLRTQDVAFSMAYFNAGLVMVTAEGVEDIATPADLVGRAAAVEWGFVPEGDVRQRALLQGLGLRRYDSAPAALRALQAGEVEVALVDRIAALAYMRDCQGLRIAAEPLADVNYVIPVRPDSFRLLSEINRVLLEMREDGTLESLQERWF
jgi:polar amino acid transport system substrate-binding protein